MSDIEAAGRPRDAARADLPTHLGLTFAMSDDGAVRGWFEVAPHHLAPNGYLHAAAIIALADTAAGYGCMRAKPAGATGFTTIEIKSNHLGTATSGRVEALARLVHGGRTTQVWDAEVTAGGRTLALFRCTQMILYPR